MDVSRRTFVGRGVAALAGLPAIGCQAIGNANKLNVILADTSLTIKSLSPAEQFWPATLLRAARSERIVLGLIMGEADQRREFRLVRDVVLPPFNIFKSRAENAKELNDSMDDLRPAMAEAIRKPRSRRTELLRSLHEVARYCEATPVAERECTFISDMLEDSEFGVFEKSPPTEKFTHQLIARQRAARELPKLYGLKFRAVGVTAPTHDIEVMVSKFWHAYLSVCGATVIDYGYQRTK